jgi:hypothetical protein
MVNRQWGIGKRLKFLEVYFKLACVGEHKGHKGKHKEHDGQNTALLRVLSGFVVYVVTCIKLPLINRPDVESFVEVLQIDLRRGAQRARRETTVGILFYVVYFVTCIKFSMVNKPGVESFG